MANIRIDQEGVKHLHGCSHNTYETLCGWCDSSNTYTDTEGVPDCYGCIIAAKEVLKNATAKEIKSWKL